MDFAVFILDPTDIKTEPIATHGTVYGWAVNLDTHSAILFVRCWRSDLARKQGCKPLLETQVTFSAQEQGPEIIEHLTSAKWTEVVAILCARLAPK